MMWVRKENYLEVGGYLAFRFAKPEGTVLGYVDRLLNHVMCGTPHPVVSNRTLFVAYRSAQNRIVIDALAPGPPYETWGGAMTVAASVSTKGIAWLNETCIDEPHLGHLELEQGKHPMLVLGWTGTDTANRLNLRLLSVDCPGSTLDYTGEP